MSMIRAYGHGLWVGSTGDVRRLRAMHRQVLNSNTMEIAWQSVTQSLNRASEESRSPSSH